jgi:hypothetical protein
MGGVKTIPRTKISYNVGACLDVPSGKFKTGLHGESYLNGGIGLMGGVAGKPNTYKSLLMEFMLLSSMERYRTQGIIYDTELNKQADRLHQLANRFPGLRGRDLFDEESLIVSDRTNYSANEWYDWFKTFMDSKVKDRSKLMLTSPFLHPTTNEPIRTIVPTSVLIDSFTKFEADATTEKLDESLGSKKVLTMYMQQGLTKAHFLTDVPKRLAESGCNLFMSAHVGQNIPMDGAMHPSKQMQFLSQQDKIKGVTNDWLYMTTIFWMCLNSMVMKHDGTKGAEYPKESIDNEPGNSDLNLVTLQSVRNKNGPSGKMVKVVVSQREGVLSGLTEFEYIKSNDRYGMGGNNTTYFLDLLPETKLMRTTVRGKLDTDPKLARAMNLTSEICQQTYSEAGEEDLFVPMAQLYDEIRTRGYDWDGLLNTRGWWTFQEYEDQELPFLSSRDLLNIRRGYHPYWLAADKKTIIAKKSKR